MTNLETPAPRTMVEVRSGAASIRRATPRRRISTSAPPAANELMNTKSTRFDGAV